MHARPELATWAVGLVALVGLGLLGTLFYHQKTRPIGWMLLGVVVTGFFGLSFVHTSRQWQPAVAVESYQYAESNVRAPVDVDALVGPRIPLEEHAAVADRSAHPPQVASPLETHAAPPTAPEEPSATTHSGGNADEAEDVAGGPAPDEVESEPATFSNGPRPAWLDPSANHKGNSFQFVVETDEHSKRQQADEQVNEEIVIKTAEVLGSLVGEVLTVDANPAYHPAYSVGDGSYRTLHRWNFEYARNRLLQLGLTPGEIRNRVWKEEYVEHTNLDLATGPMPMVKVYTLLEYAPEFRDEMQLRWRQQQSQRRLFEVGIVAACVLGGLSLVWSILKFDTVTKGYYTKWLIIGGSLVTMVVVGFLIIATS